MKTKSALSAKDFVDNLNREGEEEVCSLQNSPYFFRFLPEPCYDESVNRDFADECLRVGVPARFTKTPEALHNLVFAIVCHTHGNA